MGSSGGSQSGSTLSGVPPRFGRGLVEVGAGVWAWMQPNGSWGETNAGLVVGGSEVAVIDTLWDQRLASSMLDSIAALTASREVTYVVNTHSDGDHWWGNAAVPESAKIVTSSASLASMHLESSPQAMARMAAAAKLFAPLPGPLHGLTSYVAEMMGPFDFAGVSVRYPDTVFSGSHRLRVGDRQLDLVELGPAHTPGDLIVHVPDSGVVFAGDLLFVGVTPVMWFGPMSGWLKALDALGGLGADVYVPGHGDLCGADGIDALREYFTWIEVATKAHVDAGRSAYEAAVAMVESDEFLRWIGWDGPERLVITVDTVHRSLRSQPPAGKSPRARARLLARASAVRKRIYSLRGA